MRPGRYDLRLYRGDSRAWRFRVWQDDARTIPVDITDAEVAATIRGSCAHQPLPLQLTVTAPNIIDAVLDADEARLLTRHGTWDLQLVWPGEWVTTVLFGDVFVSDDTTRSAA